LDFGKDAGQTTMHLINAYAQLGVIGVGQTASVFMDLEVFPATLIIGTHDQDFSISMFNCGTRQFRKKTKDLPSPINVRVAQQMVIMIIQTAWDLSM